MFNTFPNVFTAVSKPSSICTLKNLSEVVIRVFHAIVLAFRTLVRFEIFPTIAY